MSDSRNLVQSHLYHSHFPLSTFHFPLSTAPRALPLAHSWRPLSAPPRLLFPSSSPATPTCLAKARRATAEAQGATVGLTPSSGLLPFSILNSLFSNSHFPLRQGRSPPSPHLFFPSSGSFPFLLSTAPKALPLHHFSGERFTVGGVDHSGAKAQEFSPAVFDH